MTLDPKSLEELPEFMSPSDCKRFLNLNSPRQKLPSGIPFFTTSCLRSDRTKKYVWRTNFVEWFKKLCGVTTSPENEEKCRLRILALLGDLKTDFQREGNTSASDICTLVIDRVKEGTYGKI